MGPPTYGRSLSQPYPRPSASERKQSKDSRLSSQARAEIATLLVPDFSDRANTFEVEIRRNSLGLGFSISGGPEAASPWTNLIRVKKIFPLQPAWETGKLRVGDIIQRVSGIPLSSLHLRQALDILRTSPAITVLQVCRVSDSSGNSWSSLQTPRSRSSIVRSYSYGPTCPPTTQYSYSTGTSTDPCPQYSYSSGPATEYSYSTESCEDSTAVFGSPELVNSVESSTGLVLSTRDPVLSTRGPVQSTRGPVQSSKEPVQCTTEGWRPALSLYNGEKMDIEISPPSPSLPSSREWSPDSESTLSLLQPVETALRNSREVVGQFSISLTKVNGSLGFTLRQLDDTVLKHTIKALVKEPALSDGRLKAGDKLLACNGVELASFSHQEVIAFLRQTPDTVSLDLYRDASRSQTPLSPEQSQFDSLVAKTLPRTPHSRTSQSPSRKLLRYEAAELVRSLQSSRTSLEKAGLASNPGSYSSGTLGRRLGRPYSPAMKERHLMLTPQPTVESPLSPLNSSAPASLSQGVTRAFQGLHLESVDPNDPHHSDPHLGPGELVALVIEEVESGGSGGVSPLVQGTVISAPHSPGAEERGHLGSGQTLSLPRACDSNYLIASAESSYHKPERPSDLKFSSSSRRQGFVFNNHWNMNRNKF